MNMPHWLAVSYCYFFKHRRGKRTSTYDGHADYMCARCGAVWTRKLPKAKHGET
jgi:hypothetical protein